MKDIYQIAIDGPGGAGKSTVAKLVAKRLGIDYIDTGAMYRAFGLKMLRNNMPMEETDALKEMLNDTEIDFNGQNVILDGEDVSGKIRTPEISKAASDCSAFPFIREKMVRDQQKMGSKKSVVMDGRDISTVVFPNAKYKFFVTATPEERAMRRYKELIEKGEKAEYQQVLDDINKRDYNDSHRKASPLRQAEDAELLDTTNMTIEEVVDYICSKLL